MSWKNPPDIVSCQEESLIIFVHIRLFFFFFSSGCEPIWRRLRANRKVLHVDDSVHHDFRDTVDLQMIDDWLLGLFHHFIFLTENFTVWTHRPDCFLGGQQHWEAVNVNVNGTWCNIYTMLYYWRDRGGLEATFYLCNKYCMGNCHMKARVRNVMWFGSAAGRNIMDLIRISLRRHHVKEKKNFFFSSGLSSMSWHSLFNQT